MCSLNELAMRRRLRRHFYLNPAAALTSIALLILTLVWRNWIEIAFGIDPDRNSGLTELGAAAVCTEVALAGSRGAGWEWKRAKASLGAAQ
jgi:hypothetical protein